MYFHLQSTLRTAAAKPAADDDDDEGGKVTVCVATSNVVAVS